MKSCIIIMFFFLKVRLKVRLNADMCISVMQSQSTAVSFTSDQKLRLHANSSFLRLNIEYLHFIKKKKCVKSPELDCVTALPPRASLLIRNNTHTVHLKPIFQSLIAKLTINPQ